MAPESGTPRVAAIFPGQGSQTVGMAVDVARAIPAAGDLFARASAVLGYDLLALCADGPDERLRATRYSQPAIFVANLALHAAVGDAVTVVASAGHSFGEYCSLTIAGALSFEEALALVNERGLAMQAAADVEPGAMSAVLGLDAEKLRIAVAAAEERTGRAVRLANFNSPSQIVVSGSLEAVVLAGELALGAGAKRVVPLNVSGAWHSPLMARARERFAPFVAEARIAEPAAATEPGIIVVSNVDARVYGTAAEIRENLVLSVTDEVLWHAAAERLIEIAARLGAEAIVEFGATPVLTPLMKRMPGVPKVLHVGDLAGVAKLSGVPA
jgi:[acyl-carrier-protein] S-malonyltransferase